MMRAVTIAALSLVLGCSSPGVVFHALPSPEPGRGDSPLTLVIGPIRLPAFLARPYITWRSGPTRLVFDEYNRWAASLDVEFLRVTADQVAARLGTSRVVTWPAQDPSGTALRITLDIEQLDVVANGPAWMRARYIIVNGAGEALVDQVADVRSEMKGTRVDDALAAYAALVEALADEIAAAVRGLGPTAALSPGGETR